MATLQTYPAAWLRGSTTPGSLACGPLLLPHPQLQSDRDSIFPSPQSTPAVLSRKEHWVRGRGGNRKVCGGGRGGAKGCPILFSALTENRGIGEEMKISTSYFLCLQGFREFPLHRELALYFWRLRLGETRARGVPAPGFPLRGRLSLPRGACLGRLGVGAHPLHTSNISHLLAA